MRCCSLKMLEKNESDEYNIDLLVNVRVDKLFDTLSGTRKFVRF